METPKTQIAVLFGGRVQHFRSKAGLSQGQLAERADVSQTYLSAIERGDKFPAGPTIESLARALGLPIYVLFVDPDQALQAQETVFDEVSRLNVGLTQVVTEWARENLRGFTKPKS